MLLNARFPFISSAGKAPSIRQFVNAGYYDNIGGTLTQELIEVFENIAKKISRSHLSKIRYSNCHYKK